jgi:hypothetical protein
MSFLERNCARWNDLGVDTVQISLSSENTMIDVMFNSLDRAAFFKRRDIQFHDVFTYFYTAYSIAYFVAALMRCDMQLEQSRIDAQVRKLPGKQQLEDTNPDHCL